MLQSSFLGHNPLGFHRIAYTTWGQPTTQPPVICVHGLIRNRRDFDNLATHLQDDRQVFCPDIVGRGESDRLPDPAGYNYAQYIQDMTAMIARSGAAQIDWVGTSMGGIIGMFLAADTNSPIRSLVINDVGPFIPLAALQRIATYVGTPPDFANINEGEAYLRIIYAGFGITRHEDWCHMAQHSLHQGQDGRWRMAYDPAIAVGLANLKEDVDFWAVYDRIQCPVLLIRGETSDVLPADVAQAMTQRGPKAQLVEIKKAGHAPALMDEAQIRLIETFFSGRPGQLV